MKYKSYTLHNYKEIPQINKLNKEQLFNIDIVSKILPFKTNSYVINNLIEWDNLENDPMYILNFPQKGMLKNKHFNEIEKSIKKGNEKEIIRKIQKELNPQPAGQIELNVPKLNNEKLPGIQHKYKETILFFPSQGQTCHAYCTFCFRWAQFTGMNELKFATNQVNILIEYIKNNKNITDILITGGDPMIMSFNILSKYINSILNANIPHLKNIRIGTKSLSFWPYRFISDKDSDDIIRLFEKIIKSGKHLSIMAHFTHPKELSTDIVKKAIKRIRSTGAQIRTQSPIIQHINDNSNIWIDMWKKQVNLGLIPYYMFIPRNTGSQPFFAISLNKAFHIFKNSYNEISGLCRTVRGPVMSSNPGKICIDGVSEIVGKKFFILHFIQGRNKNWVNKPFFANFDENAIWFDELKPAFKDEFFFQKEFKNKYNV